MSFSLPFLSILSDWGDKLHETFIESGYLNLMFEGFKNTIIITLGALAIGVFLGTLIALLKVLCDGVPGLRIVSKICDAYVNVIRGIPVVVLLLIFFFIIFASSEGVPVAILTFGINSAAYMAELIRGGIGAVDRGQTEAGRSLGLSRLQTMRKIVLPQAVRYILPAIGNEMIALIKETSVAGYVSVIDLTRAGNLVRNNTFDSFNPLIIVALVYLILVLGLSKVMNLAERKLTGHDRSHRSYEEIR